MPHIANLTEILAAADILSVAQRFLPGLTREGSSWATQCPIHNGHGRSLKIAPAKGTFRCWSKCQTGGDSLRLVAFLRRLDLHDGPQFQEAVEILAEEVGVPVVYDRTGGNAPSGPTRADLFVALATAHAHYQANLASHPDALAYLASRGFTRELVRAWELGYARGNGVLALGIPEEHLVKSGLASRSDRDGHLYDPLAGRLLIPQRNPSGRIVGYAGRLLESPGTAALPSGSSSSSPEPPSHESHTSHESHKSHSAPQYKNTPETALYKKGELLFGYSQAITMPGPVLLLEGQLKVVACHHAGLRAVAPGGTAFTPVQAALLQRLAAHVHLAYDNDPAGAEATLRAAALLRPLSIPMQVANLVYRPDLFPPGAKVDPDDLLAKAQPISYHPRPYLAWAVTHHLGNLAGPDRAAAISQHLLPLVNHHADHLVRMAELSQLAELTGLPLSQLGRALPPLPPPDPEPVPASPQMTSARLLVSAILQAPAGTDLKADDPTWYLEWIDWAHLPLSLVEHLQRAHRVRETARAGGLLLGPAIYAAAGRFADQYALWAEVTHPSAITPDYLIALQATIPQEPQQ